jgi:hypothetical protein
VIAEKPTPTEIECTSFGVPIPTAVSTGSSSDVTAGSPIQPRPRLASVMPNCVAAIASSSRSTARAAAGAPRLPACTHSFSCERRTATSANSVATK